MDRPVDDSAQVTAFQTALGWMAVAWTESGLARFTMGHPSAQAALASAGGQTVPTDRAPAQICELVGRMQAYAAGEPVSFSDLKLDLSHLSEFQKRVVTFCRKIPRGKTLTYGELAAKAGSPGAARAVGSVMAKNRFPIVVPCHRVVGSGGCLGGFSAPQGLSLKTRMLQLEGCELSQARRKSARRKSALA